MRVFCVHLPFRNGQFANIAAHFLLLSSKCRRRLTSRNSRAKNRIPGGSTHRVPGRKEDLSHMDAAQRAVRRRDFLAGVRDGVPIGLGYLAVAFSLGIAARSAGLNAFQGLLISLLNNASAGAALATATGDESEAEFGEGKAAFYQNGTWEYSNLTGTFGMDPADLAMIPIYCGVDGEEKAGLCAGTENCWAINNESSEEDIQATIDFLVWVVTSDEGTTMLAEEFGPCPFKDAKDPENVFFQDANKYTAEGNYVVTWAFNWTPAVDDWRAAVVDALTQYTAGTGDWSAVETAFVQGWATQYAKENA